MIEDSNKCRFILDDGSQCPNVTEQGTSLCLHHSNWLPADLEVYKAITEHFRQDIRQFWVRSNFYLIIQVGLLSFFVSITPDMTNPSIDDMITTIAMAILGLSIAVVWFIISRGAVQWIKRWREQTILIDNVVDRFKIYSKVEGFAETSPLMSPSNVTQFLPILFFTIWLFMIVLRIYQYTQLL